MTPYHDSLWRDAPEGATAWGVQISTDAPAFLCIEGYALRVFANGKWHTSPREIEDFRGIHVRPRAYRSAQQLTDEYLSEHREELETDVAGFLGDTRDDERLNTDHILSDLCFWLVLLEKHLATERAKIEKETP